MTGCHDETPWSGRLASRVGGPPPLAHHTYNTRNIASAIAASGTPRFTSSSGHTLDATAARRKPETMARSGMGNFIQKLGERVCVVITSNSGNVRADLTVSCRVAHNFLSGRHPSSVCYFFLGFA